MTFRCILLSNRLIILPVGTILPRVLAFWIIAWVVSSLFNKKFGGLQIFFIASYAIQFYQTHLHYFVAGRNFFLINRRTEDRTNKIRIFQCDVQEIFLSCS